MLEGIRDPLAVVEAVHQIGVSMQKLNLQIEVSSDFARFTELRMIGRNSKTSPMFDPAVNKLDWQNGFWVAGHDLDNKLVCLQAFRRNAVDSSLADWVPGWMAGQYIKRNELVSFNSCTIPSTSITHSVSGNLVYHGELWIDRMSKRRQLADLFPRYGMLMALIKWQPDAIWALVGTGMATRGYMVRLGYAQVENGFLRWNIEPEGAEPVEWVALASRSHLEYLASDPNLINPPVHKQHKARAETRVMGPEPINQA